MTTETNVQTDNAVTNTEVPQPSLESIAKEIPVEQQVQQFTAVPQQPVNYQQNYQPQQPYIPDPITDAEGYKRLMMAQLGQTSQIEGILRDVSTKLQSYEQREKQAKIDTEVNDVVSKVNSKLKLDPDLVEASLNVRYKKDPAFKYIWDNRQRNPAALQKALDVITNEMQSKYQVRQDPQLVENIRAAKSSQQSMASQSTQAQKFSDNPREFDRQWAEFKATGRLPNGG